MTILKFSSEKYKQKISQPLLWNKNSKTFSIEYSEISQISDNFIRPPKNLEILDINTNKSILFTKGTIDFDGSGEDIYGWNYEAINCKLLIVND